MKILFPSLTFVVCFALPSIATGATFITTPEHGGIHHHHQNLHGGISPRRPALVTSTTLSMMVQTARERGLELKRKQEELKKENEKFIPAKAQRYNKWEELLDPSNYVPKVTDRIAIIGAGPAGLHMAFKLGELGFKNVKILEKDSRFAGKSFTEYRYEPDIPQEFGTCYTIPYKYQELRRIANVTGNVKFEEIPVPQRHVFTNYTDKDPSTQDKWLISSKKKKCPFEFLPDIIARLAVGLDMFRYINHHNELFQRDINDIVKETNMDFQTYLTRNGFEDLIPLISLANTVQGYGYISSVPALYGLWWNGPAEIKGFIATQFQIVEQPASILRHGFVQYWDWLYQKAGLNIQEGVNIVKMERNDTHVVITDDTGTQEEYDFCVITCNLKDSLNFLDARPEEQEILGALSDRSNLITTLFSCKHIIDPTALSSWTLSLDPKNEARLMTVRNSAKVFYPEKVGDRERDYLISYQYVEVAKDNTTDYRTFLEKKLLDDLAAARFENVTVHEQKVWPYFQRWSQDGLNKGYPVKLMKRQGDLRTWFAGASTLFESVHDCMEYNLLLTSMIAKDRGNTGTV